ncbi:MAG: HypC/HybG/HupF family hydrogenase formation chaperone [Acidobacteriia bacterium]|nr:HypC/HybG/HupF family hydrogenase formation chaperone [Terriglobia bacterium]
MADSKRGDVSLAPTQCDPVCITCSDQGVTARVLEIFPDGTANVDTGANHIEQISVELVDAAVGDFVLTHAKVAIANVSRTP